MPEPDRRCSVWFDRNTRWADECRDLRVILLDTALTEAFKWRHPIYTFGGANVAGLENHKAGFGLAFFKGVLLEDPGGHLSSPGPNSHHARRLSLTDRAELPAMEPVLRNFIAQAIRLEEEGRTVKGHDPTIAHPEELAAALDADPALADAFHTLTPGRRRGWLLQFASARRSATRASRVAKATPKILAGQGPHDR